jgi:hypothetical protein
MLMLAMLLCACATTHRDKLMEDMVEARESMPESESLEAQFTSERISLDELAAFETRAQQKLQDFSDYVNLIADPTIDSLFREQATRQALSLFASTNTLVVLHDKKETVADLLYHLRRSGESPSYIIQSIEILHHLQPTANQQYRGTLSFQQMLSQENAPAITRQADIRVKKVEKTFGEKKEWVWEVFLAGIE